MPPLIAAIIVGAGAYAGYRIAGHVWARLNEVIADADRPVTDEATVAPLEKDLGTLERDPATGIYRPRQQG